MRKDEFDDLVVGMPVLSTYTGKLTRHRVIAIDRLQDRPVIQVTEWPLRSNGGWVDVALFYLEGEGDKPLSRDETII